MRALPLRVPGRWSHACGDHHSGVQVPRGAHQDATPEEILTRGINQLKSAPVKPQQRLYILRTHLLPKLHHKLVLSRSQVSGCLLQTAQTWANAGVCSASCAHAFGCMYCMFVCLFVCLFVCFVCYNLFVCFTGNLGDWVLGKGRFIIAA